MRDLASLRLSRRGGSACPLWPGAAECARHSSRQLGKQGPARLTGTACCPPPAASPPASHHTALQASTRACTVRTRGGRRGCKLCGPRKTKVSSRPVSRTDSNALLSRPRRRSTVPVHHVLPSLSPRLGISLQVLQDLGLSEREAGIAVCLVVRDDEVFDLPDACGVSIDSFSVDCSRLCALLDSCRRGTFLRKLGGMRVVATRRQPPRCPLAYCSFEPTFRAPLRQSRRTSERGSSPRLPTRACLQSCP